MKDFDIARAERASRERDFVLGGEMFVVRAGVRPEELVEYSEYDPQTAASDATLKVMDNLILTFIEPTGDAHERWRALRERSEDAITLEDLTELSEWLMEAVTARPTEQPGASGRGAGPTDRILMGVSSSPEAATG